MNGAKKFKVNSGIKTVVDNCNRIFVFIGTGNTAEDIVNTVKPLVNTNEKSTLMTRVYMFLSNSAVDESSIKEVLTEAIKSLPLKYIIDIFIYFNNKYDGDDIISVYGSITHIYPIDIYRADIRKVRTITRLGREVSEYISIEIGDLGISVEIYEDETKVTSVLI